MTTATTNFFADLAPAADRPLGLSADLSTIIASYLSDALNNRSRNQLAEISDDLASLFKGALRLAPPEVVDAVLGDDMESVIRTSYEMGQLSFSRLISSSVLARRMDDGGDGVVLDSANKKYLCVLYNNDLTNTELSNVTRQRVETVSRRVKKLRDLGLLEFRREGVNVVNFLTPFAKATLESQGYVGNGKVAPAAQEMLDELNKKVPVLMKEFPLFGRGAA
ncbi:helix-turn-helix domain-containing protein [Pseudomonas chlororaphis]|uniref:helix-turn-helix domain-containing protein n=1 Tax=Pseudomonas chlororaphis TaxID=587753 RepID=UPI001475818D|nr:helix-turn-helix domain-containing protein [Pseudomonas chlororaphis]NNB46322.1 helix-turn-helix transcriptional regulator [Pseudomonas chlororaphis]